MANLTETDRLGISTVLMGFACIAHSVVVFFVFRYFNINVTGLFLIVCGVLLRIKPTVRRAVLVQLCNILCCLISILAFFALVFNAGKFRELTPAAYLIYELLYSLVLFVWSMANAALLESYVGGKNIQEATTASPKSV